MNNPAIPKGYAGIVYSNWGFTYYKYEGKFYRVPSKNSIPFRILDGGYYNFHIVPVKKLKSHPKCVKVNKIDRSYGHQASE
jgi:hypothetical protein